MRLSFYPLLFLIILQGCTTTNGYSDPQGPLTSVALLKGEMDMKSLFEFTAVSVEAIDERRIPFTRRGTLYKFKLAPGKHKILVNGGFNNGFGPDCPCEARLVVTGNFKAGREYRLKGSVKDNRMLAWIEDTATSQRVSNIASEPYMTSPKDTYIPVIIN